MCRPYWDIRRFLMIQSQETARSTDSIARSEYANLEAQSMTIDLEKAKAEDYVGKDFAANYIPGVTEDQYQKAKDVMSRLLAKYGGRDDLEKDEADWATYKANMYIAASYSEDQYQKWMENRKGLIERKNKWAAFLEAHSHLVFDLSCFAKNAIDDFVESGRLRGLENLESLYARADNPKEKFNDLGNIIYVVKRDMGENAPALLILPSAHCGADWKWMGDIQYTS